VDEHGDALFAYAVGRVGDRAAAEDLVQETFVAALRGFGRFRGESQSRTWLIGILRHKVLDHHRRSRREHRVDDEANPGLDHVFDARGSWRQPPGRWPASPEDALDRREFREVLDRCVEGLPGRQAQAFAMKDMDEMASTEVCAVLEVSPNNLWVLLHRARTRLRRCLETHWFGRRDAAGGV